jgi:hypothetical protein
MNKKKNMQKLICLYKVLIVLLLPTKSNAQQFYIKPNTQLVLNGDVSLVVNNASLHNNGIIVPTSSTVYLTGYSDSSVSNITGTSRTTLTNLAINKQADGSAIKSMVDITNTLVMMAGNIYSDSTLTLKSTASATARITPVPASCQILGKFLIERYIPARRSWRLLTSPLYNTNTIYNTWQNQGAYAPGAGMYVTGPNPTGELGNGLDSSIRNNTSMFKWNNNTQALEAISNTHVNISEGIGNNAANTGYFTFVRGDRTYSNFTIPNRNITTLTSYGHVQTGTQTFSSCSACNNAGQYFLIGNPFASPIDFNSLSRTNLVKRFYVWDAAINTQGGYVMLDDLDGDGVFTKSVNASNQGRDIQSGQAFFIETQNAGSSALTVAEADKSANNNTVVFRPSSPFAVAQNLRVTLNSKEPDSTFMMADEVLAEFDSTFSDEVRPEDAHKFGNIDEGISLARHGKLLAAERRPVIDTHDTLFIKLSKVKIKSYQFRFTSANFDSPNVVAVLEDRFLNAIKVLSLNTDTNYYNFSISSDTASSGAGRFKIVFRNNISTLPVHFINLSATPAEGNCLIEWKVTNEADIVKYEIEKAVNDNSFQSIGCISIAGSNLAGTYKWKDAHLNMGNIFYRIKSISNNAVVKYSQIIKVNFGKEDYINVFPNPVTGNAIQVSFFNQPEGRYHFALTNAEGKIFYETSRNITGNYIVQSFLLKDKIAPGVYRFIITGNQRPKRLFNLFFK